MKKVISVLIIIFGASLVSCSIAKENSSISDSLSFEPIEESSKIETINKYKVEFYNYDNSLLYECDVEEGKDAIYLGDEPTKPSLGEISYRFIGWDKELTKIKNDLITIAQFEEYTTSDWGEIEWFIPVASMQ